MEGVIVLSNAHVTTIKAQAYADKNIAFISAYKIETAHIELRDLYIDWLGVMFYTEHPLYLDIYDTYVDTSRIVKGFIINSACDYAGANLMGEIHIERTTFRSFDRNEILMAPLIDYSGP